jgi:hypothetical protein
VQFRKKILVGEFLSGENHYNLVGGFFGNIRKEISGTHFSCIDFQTRAGTTVRTVVPSTGVGNQDVVLLGE